MQKISGLEISKEIVQKLKTLPKPAKTMAAILVGDDPISANFVNEKKKIADELGVSFKIITFSGDLTDEALRTEVNRIASDELIGGVVVQLPLPAHINRHEILKDIPKSKDVDVLGSESIASFYTTESGVLPPSCGVVDEICRRFNVDLAQSRVAVIGMGLLIGKPLAIYLMHRAKEIILLDKMSDLEPEVREADVIISGVGRAKLISPEGLKKGATVIDFGYDYSAGKLVGDFDHTLDDSNETRLAHLKVYTPTPGGTGPILVAKLFENFYKLNLPSNIITSRY